MRIDGISSASIQTSIGQPPPNPTRQPISLPSDPEQAAKQKVATLPSGSTISPPGSSHASYNGTASAADIKPAEIMSFETWHTSSSNLPSKTNSSQISQALNPNAASAAGAALARGGNITASANALSSTATNALGITSNANGIPNSRTGGANSLLKTTSSSYGLAPPFGANGEGITTSALSGITRIISNRDKISSVFNSFVKTGELPPSGTKNLEDAIYEILEEIRHQLKRNRKIIKKKYWQQEEEKESKDNENQQEHAEDQEKTEKQEAAEEQPENKMHNTKKLKQKNNELNPLNEENNAHENTEEEASFSYEPKLTNAQRRAYLIQLQINFLNRDYRNLRMLEGDWQRMLMACRKVKRHYAHNY